MILPPSQDEPQAADPNAALPNDTLTREPVDPRAIPPKPPEGEIVSDEILYLQQFSTYRLAEAFAGQTSPTLIWQEMIRDTPQAILFYRELEEKDEDVSGALEDLKLSVLKRDRSITPGDESQLAQYAADFITEQFDNLPNFHQSLDNLLDAAAYGFALCEMIFDYSMGQVSLMDVRDCPQELFLFAPRFYPQIGPLRFMQTIYDFDGTPVPEEKFAIFSYRMRSRNRRGRALLRKVFWPSWFKRQITRFWLRFGERGPGTAVTRFPAGATADEKKQALLAAESLIERVAMAVPDSMKFELELLQIARSQDPKVYESLAERMEQHIWRTINGQTLTSHGSDGGKGTQALGEVHQQVQETRGVELARALEKVVNQQIVRRLVMWNFGPDCPMPQMQFDTSQAEDLSRRVTVDSTLQRMGKKFTAQYIADRYEVPLVEGEEEVLAPAQAGGDPTESPAGSPERPTKPSFGEQEKEWEQFDQLFGRLKQQAVPVLRDRAKEIVEGAAAAAAGAGDGH